MGDETVSEKKRCVIVGGADIGDYARVKQYLRADDAIVFCDSGLKHMEALGVKPALIVGDFDSHCNPHLDVETIVLPCEKDDTDTVFAVKTMVQRGYDVFLLIGVIGARLDHTLGNVSILLYLDSLGKKAEIVDDYSEMQIVSKDEVSIEDKYPFFSLLNITGCARGITIRDAKYPLDGKQTRVVKAAANSETTGTIGEGILDVYHAGNLADVIRGKASALNSPIAEAHVSTNLCHLGNMAYRTNSVLAIDPKTGRPMSDAAMKLWSVDYQPGWEIKG